MLARDRGHVCRVRWQDEIGAEQPRFRWPHLNQGGDFGDPYRRTLLHLDFYALFASEELSSYLQPYDLAVSGDRLLVLCGGFRVARICVFDSQTGAFLYHIGEADRLTAPMSLAAHQDLCFVADTYEHVIKIFNFRQRTLVRTIGSAAATPSFDEFNDVDPWRIMHHLGDARRSDLPCEFNEPVGVAFRDGRLYVSEASGRRIQILRFANGFHGPVECLQIIPSPYGTPLAGLCVSGERLWCLGQARGGSDSMMPSTDGCLHLFTACV